MTVWWSSRRTTENTAPGSGSATRTSSPAGSSGVATSYDGSSGSAGVSQTWTNRVCGAAATSECVTPEPVRSTATCPGSTRAGPVGPSCSSAPEITQVTIVRSAWSCGGNPSPTAQQVVVVADHRAEPHVVGVVRRAEREGVGGEPPGLPVHESVGSPADLNGHVTDCACGGLTDLTACPGSHRASDSGPALRRTRSRAPSAATARARASGTPSRPSRARSSTVRRARRRATTTTATPRTSR